MKFEEIRFKPHKIKYSYFRLLNERAETSKPKKT